MYIILYNLCYNYVLIVKICLYIYNSGSFPGRHLNERETNFNFKYSSARIFRAIMENFTAPSRYKF